MDHMGIFPFLTSLQSLSISSGSTEKSNEDIISFLSIMIFRIIELSHNLSENIFEIYSQSTLNSHQTCKESDWFKRTAVISKCTSQMGSTLPLLLYVSESQFECLSVSSVSSLSLPEPNATTPPDPSGVEAGKSLECVVKDEDLYSQYFTFWLSKTNRSKEMMVMGQRAKVETVGFESHLDDINISNVHHVQDWVCACNLRAFIHGAHYECPIMKVCMVAFINTFIPSATCDICTSFKLGGPNPKTLQSIPHTF